MSPVLSTSSGSSCVYAGIAILQIHPLDVRQVRDVDRVRRRANAVRLDGVLRLRADVEETERETAVLSGVIGSRVHVVESALRTSSSTLSDWNPRNLASISWSPPFATVAFPGSTEMLNKRRGGSPCPRHGDELETVPQHRRAEHRDQHRARRAPRRESRHWSRSSPASIALSVAGEWTRSSAARVNRSMNAGERIGTARGAPRPFCISTAVITVALSDAHAPRDRARPARRQTWAGAAAR